MTAILGDDPSMEFDLFKVHGPNLSIGDHIRNLGKLDRMVRSKRYDVIVGDNTGMFALQLAILGRMHGIPTLLRLRGDCWTEYKDAIGRASGPGGTKAALVDRLEWAFTWAGLRCMDGFLPVSRYIEGEIRKRFGHDKKVFVLQTYSNEGLLAEYRPDVDISERRYITTVTNCNFPRKIEAILDHVDDIVQVLERHPRLTFLVLAIGEGFEEFKAEFMRRVDGRVDRIEFRANERDMVTAYNSSLVYLHLSYLDAFPTVVVEAQSIGVPVISTACCGMVEQIEDGRTGFLVPRDRRGLVVKAIDRLLGDEGLYKRMRQAAHDHCRKSYSVGSRTDILHRALKEMARR